MCVCFSTVRKWRFAATCAGLVAALSLLPEARAQGQPAAPRTVTIDQAIDYALQNYPAVRASLEELSAAHAQIGLARTAYLPQLSGIYQDSRATQNQVNGIWLPTPFNPAVEGPVQPYTGQSFWASQAAALFSWEPLDFGLRSERVDRARSAEDKSKADLALTRLQIAAAVGNYFLLAAASEQATAAAQANVERWRVFAQSTHTLVDNQLRPGADASRADAELARATVRLYQARQAERNARDTLAALMGAAGSEFQTDSSRLLDHMPEGSIPESAASEHPLARDQMAAVRQIQADEKVLNRTDYPRLFLQAEVFGRGSEIPTSGSIIGNWNGLAPARGNWITGVSILFPDVFGLKALSAQKQISKAEEQSQKAHYDQVIQDVTGQIQAAKDQLKLASLIADETPAELAAARQSETQSRARYEASLATLVEVADAENLLAQAEVDDAVARLNVWHALFTLANAQGDLQGFLQVLHGPPAGAP
jgi:outer membrane protein